MRTPHSEWARWQQSAARPALGLLLRPAAGRLLVAGVAPAELVGRSVPVPDAPIDELDRALSEPTPVPVLTALLSRWLGPPHPDTDLTELALSLQYVALRARRFGE